MRQPRSIDDLKWSLNNVIGELRFVVLNLDEGIDGPYRDEVAVLKKQARYLSEIADAVGETRAALRQAILEAQP